MYEKGGKKKKDVQNWGKKKKLDKIKIMTGIKQTHINQTEDSTKA